MITLSIFGLSLCCTPIQFTRNRNIWTKIVRENFRNRAKQRRYTLRPTGGRHLTTWSDLYRPSFVNPNLRPCLSLSSLALCVADVLWDKYLTCSSDQGSILALVIHRLFTAKVPTNFTAQAAEPSNRCPLDILGMYSFKRWPIDISRISCASWEDTRFRP